MIRLINKGIAWAILLTLLIVCGAMALPAYIVGVLLSPVWHGFKQGFEHGTDFTKRKVVVLSYFAQRLDKKNRE